MNTSRENEKAADSKRIATKNDDNTNITHEVKKGHLSKTASVINFHEI